MPFIQLWRFIIVKTCLVQWRSSEDRHSVFKRLINIITKNNCFFLPKSYYLGTFSPLVLTLKGVGGKRGPHMLCCLSGSGRYMGVSIHMYGKKRWRSWILHCYALLFPVSYRKWFQMKGIKVDSYWKNQSCCISKGIPLASRSLSSISPHSSGELNRSPHVRYWPIGFLTETALL